MSEDLFREMVQASVVLDGLPEYGGYNGSAFVIDDIERDRIVAAIDKVILVLQIYKNDKERMLDVIKAVAHIGCDLEPEHIAKAREIYEANT